MPATQVLNHHELADVPGHSQHVQGQRQLQLVHLSVRDRKSDLEAEELDKLEEE